MFDYVWEEEQFADESIPDREHREVTTHVSIHTLSLDGTREMYRHFLRLPDGAIVELFGTVGVDPSFNQRSSIIGADLFVSHCAELTTARVKISHLLERSTVFLNETLAGEVRCSSHMIMY